MGMKKTQIELIGHQNPTTGVWHVKEEGKEPHLYIGPLVEEMRDPNEVVHF